jgi:hypothetical protein
VRGQISTYLIPTGGALIRPLKIRGHFSGEHFSEGGGALSVYEKLALLHQICGLNFLQFLMFQLKSKNFVHSCIIKQLNIAATEIQRGKGHDPLELDKYVILNVYQEIKVA